MTGRALPGTLSSPVRAAARSRVETARQVVHQATDHGIALARLTRDLPRFLRTTITADDARAQVRQRLETREARFANLVERAVYGFPRSPYLALLRHAGCELGDLRALLRQEGIEGALGNLAQRGVYVTFDELKGRRDAIRGSRRFSFRQQDFDNPLARAHLVRYTGGSGGPPSRVPYSLEYIAAWAATVSLSLRTHGFDGTRIAFWYPAPVHWLMASAQLGLQSVAWYYPVHPLPARVSALARYLALLGRLGGHQFPLPQRRDLSEADDMARWVAGQLRTGGPLALVTMASMGVRLGVAAGAAGHDLTGVTIVSLGEAVTEARRRHIEASGARLIVHYSTVEMTGLGCACGNPQSTDDVHIMVDQYAVAQRTREIRPDGPTVDALLVSGLEASAGKVMLNVEPGDFGQLAVRDCSCLFGSLGLTTHLSGIRSFEKLTGEGVTFARADLQRILDEVLPARFGGTSLDYQLAEEEAVNSEVRLVVRVSPTVGALDDGALRACLLDELAASGIVERYQASIWRNAGTVEVRREAPRATHRGKVMPFQVQTGRETRA